MTLTVNPGDADRLEDSYKEQTHAARCVIVKQLEDVHPTLRERREQLY